MPDGARKTTDDQQAAIGRALVAAGCGDPRGMLAALHEGAVLDGLARTFRGKWPSLGPDEIDFVVAEAVDALYQRASHGETIISVVAFLWKVCDRRACDRHRERSRERSPIGEEFVDGSGARQVGVAGLDPEADWDARRARAISLARSLLPRLGQDSVQRVMAFVLDAIELGREDLPSSEVGSALGLTVGTVRTSLSRGFARLARIARDEHLIDEDAEIANLQPPDTDNDCE